MIHFSWGWAGFVLAMLAVLPIAWFTYRFEGKSVKESTKRKLLTLRIIWLVLVCFLLTGPTLVVSGWVPLQNRLAVMLDTCGQEIFAILMLSIAAGGLVP